MAGSHRRFFQINKAEALELHSIIQELTPSRVGNNEQYYFLAAIASEIEESFPADVRSSERLRNNLTR